LRGGSGGGGRGAGGEGRGVRDLGGIKNSGWELRCKGGKRKKKRRKKKIREKWRRQGETWYRRKNPPSEEGRLDVNPEKNSFQGQSTGAKIVKLF